MRTTSLIQLAAVGVFLVGCTSTAERMVKEGIEPMTVEELRTLVTGNSFYQRHQGATSGTTMDSDLGEWTGYYRSDGTMSGRAWGAWGQDTANGIWEITDGGLVCEDWDNHWHGGGYACFRFYQDGENIIYDHASGSKGRYPTGTYRPATGNAYNL